MMTKRDVYVIPARTSEGTMYCLKGRNKTARKDLAERYGNPKPSGYHVLTFEQLQTLAASLKDGH